MNITNSYSLEWFIKFYIGCNLWFNKFTPLQDELYPWLRTTGLGKYLCFAFLQVLLHSLCPHSFNNHQVNPSIIWHVAYPFSQIPTNLKLSAYSFGKQFSVLNFMSWMFLETGSPHLNFVISRQCLCNTSLSLTL